MVVIRAELWKKGNPEDKVLLGVAYIKNNGFGSEINQNIGDYYVEITKKNSETHIFKQGKVLNFPRKKLGVWDLLYRALKEIVGDRND